MIKGKKIYLTAIEKEDLPYFKEWRNREDFRKNFREYREINSEMQEKWYENVILNDKSTIMFSIRSVKDNKLIGSCGLCYIDWINRHAELSIYIGKDNAYIDDKGYAIESCNILMKYGFEEVGLNKIWSEVYEIDSKKLELYNKLNFKQDGILRENYFHKGKWWNSIVFSVLNKEWKNINKK